MKKIFAIFVDAHRINAFEKNLNFFIDPIKLFIPEDYEGYIINLSFLEFGNKGIDLNNKGLKLNIFQPKNLRDLIFFLKKNKIISVTKILYNFNNLFFHFLIKYYNVKQIIIANLGYFPVENQTRTKNFKKKISFILKNRLKYYFFRLLSLSGFISNIEVFFTSSKEFKDRINVINNSKFKNTFRIFYKPFYKNVVRVNSHYYDRFLEFESPSDEFIVYCDSGLDHYDRTVYDEPINSEGREDFYKKLGVFLDLLSNKFNKKIIYCLHPKVQYPASNNFNLLKKKFIFKKYETEKYISKSYLSIFSSSLLINFAILMKKKILMIESKDFGEFIQNRNQNYLNQFNFERFNLDKIYNVSDIQLNNLEKNVDDYEKFIELHLVNEKQIKSFEQVKRFISKNL